MSTTLPPWRPLLRAAQQREGRRPSSRWLQLASIHPDGTPRVRTLVFRCWSGSDQLDLFSDQRSSKIDELRHQARTELCWMLPQARQQFRLRGPITLFTPQDAPEPCQRTWDALRPSSRALWGWPTPGSPYQAEAHWPEALDDGTALPAHFVVLRLQVLRVEQLDLRPHPHERRVWCAEQNWTEERLNP